MQTHATLYDVESLDVIQDISAPVVQTDIPSHGQESIPVPVDDLVAEMNYPDTHPDTQSLSVIPKPKLVELLDTLKSVDGPPFQCFICYKSKVSACVLIIAFPKRWFLKRHLMAHSDEKSYQCLICGRAYKRSETLLKHHKEKHLSL